VKLVAKTIKTDVAKRKEGAKVSLKTSVLAKLTVTRDKVKKAFSKPKTAHKKSKKATKSGRILAKQQRNNAILGIGLLLVVVSILYSTSVILIGVSSVPSKIALFPQAFFALLILIKAFSKIYK
jgi:hypothetical protein